MSRSCDAIVTLSAAYRSPVGNTCQTVGARNGVGYQRARNGRRRLRALDAREGAAHSLCDHGSIQGDAGRMLMEALSRTVFIVTMKVEPEWDAELNRWYDEEHIPYLLKVPGYHSARRY